MCSSENSAETGCLESEHSHVDLGYRSIVFWRESEGFESFDSGNGNRARTEEQGTVKPLQISCLGGFVICTTKTASSLLCFHNVDSGYNKPSHESFFSFRRGKK